jgi:tetratricopeptide (TPR) repeat protein
MVRQPAASYDSVVAGLDEAHARTALAEMQERLARGPNAALGIPAGASSDDARTAFLQLTKRYHPVRFGRMATDIQKQANEVFLALRAAHDAVARSLRRPGVAPTASIPALSGPTDGRGGQPLPARAARPGSPPEPGERPPAQPSTPSMGAKPAANRPGVPTLAPRAPAPLRTLGSGPAASVRDEAGVLDLLQRQQWDQARSALHQLLARDPSSKRTQALLCYARGREAQLDRRLDDARVELQDALDLDPDLQAAKTALTELFTRRK